MIDGQIIAFYGVSADALLVHVLVLFLFLFCFLLISSEAIPFKNLVSELVDVVEESVERVGRLVGMGTVEGALAGLDHHDVLVEGLAVLAAELDPDGAGLLGAAAPAVHAGSAVLGSVLLEAGTAGVGELHCLGGLLCSVALLPFLLKEKQWTMGNVSQNNPVTKLWM